MFNECLIYLCDCTWLNLLHMLNYMLIKNKQIFFFECFSCFWKVLLFWKNIKNFKNCATLFWQLASRVKPVASPQSGAYIEGFHDSLVGYNPSREKDLEIFSKIWVFRFLATQFGGLFASGSSSHEVYSESVVAPFATSLQVDLLVAKNT